MAASWLPQITTTTAPRGKDETVQVQPLTVKASPPEDVDKSVPMQRQVPVQVGAPDQAPPSNVAILRIYANGQGFNIQGHEGSAVRLEATSPKPPALLCEKTPTRIDHNLQTLKGYPALQKFVEWVKQLRAAHKEEFYLVIQEHTSTGIPWEMVKVGSSYVGALVTTVRWEDFAPCEEDNIRTLSDEEARCEGEVVSYAVPEVLSDDITAEERRRVDSFLQALLGGPARFDAIRKFYQALRKTQGGVGLVYLLCHGYLVSDFQASYLGSMRNEEERMTLADFDRWPMRLLQRSKPVVFLDACSLGRMEENPDPQNILRQGFPQLFLSHGSRAVIGALARVKAAYAARLASELVELSRKHPELPLPELLRQLREQAVEARQHAADVGEDEDACWARWYYTFLYVYYGYPRTRLALTRGEAGHG